MHATIPVILDEEQKCLFQVHGFLLLIFVWVQNGFNSPVLLTNCSTVTVYNKILNLFVLCIA